MNSVRGARDKLDEALRHLEIDGYASTGISRDKNNGKPALLVLIDYCGDRLSVPEEFDGFPVSVKYVNASKFNLG